MPRRPARGGRQGAGLLMVHIPDPFFVLVAGSMLALYGPGGLVLACVVNGLVAIVAGYAMPMLRSVLPPTVAGIVVCLAGISLVEPALGHVTGLAADGSIRAADLAAGGLTLGIIVVLSVWGSRRVRLYALLAGLAAGVGLAAALGQIDGAEALAGTPLFDPPTLPTPRFDIAPDVILAVAVMALMTQLDTFGSVVLLQKMNDADFKRPGMTQAGKAMRAQGIATVLSAPLGAFPTAVSSANIALTHISRSLSRYIGLACALALLLAAFLPPVSLALTLIPTPVIGAVELYAAAYLIVSGIELIMSRTLDSRGIFTIGLAFIAGLGVMFVPQLARLFPEGIQFLVSSGIIVAGITAIALNLVFRLGTSRQAELPLSGTGEAENDRARQLIDFIERQGGLWSARRDVVQRAAQATLEAAEAIAAVHGPGALQSIQASFDEYNLDVELHHTGNPLTLDAATGSIPTSSLLEADDGQFDAALASALASASNALVRRLSDRATSGRNGQACWLRLHFDH